MELKTKDMMDRYNRAVNSKFGNDLAFQKHLGKEKSSFKRRFENFLLKVADMNKYLHHLNLEFRLVFKGQDESKRKNHRIFFSLELAIQEAKRNIAMISSNEVKKTDAHIMCEMALEELKKENPNYENLKNIRMILRGFNERN